MLQNGQIFISVCVRIFLIQFFALNQQSWPISANHDTIKNIQARDFLGNGDERHHQKNG